MLKYIIGLILLTLTTLVTSSKAQTTCTTNDLGDRTCTTVTSGTTTGNILTNSTFGTGSTTNTTGWSTTGDHGIHTHGNFNFTYPSGADTSGGVLAFEGDPADNVYQDQDLVGDGHLTKSQINEGFTSTQSADVWFWNNIENTLTLKQTITAADGTVTTQTRVINDHNPNRAFNGGNFENMTNVYTHSANTQNDFTIRTELYNETAGTSYDSYHRGPDVDNVQLSITTAGSTVTSTEFTPCAVLNTCTDAGNDVADAVDLKTDDGVDLFEDLDTKVEDAIKDFEEVEIVSIDTVVMIEDDLGELEEVKLEDFVEQQFTTFLEENNLVEEFENALIEENITSEEFFDEATDMIKEEFSMEDEPMEVKDEETIVVAQEDSNDVLSEETTETNTIQSEEETNANTNNTTETNTTEETVETDEEKSSSGQENETVSNERTVDENSEAEGQETETSSNETVEDTENVRVENGNSRSAVDEKVSGISKKVEKIIAKLEKKLKKVSDKLQMVSYVTSKGITQLEPDMSAYKNKKFYSQTNPYKTNLDFFDEINRIEQQQIYTDVTLRTYTNNDPIAVHRAKLNEVNSKISSLEAEIRAMKELR